jgi:hypothetical protein
MNLLDLPREIFERIANYTIETEAEWSYKVKNEFPLRLVHSAFESVFTPRIMDTCHIVFREDDYFRFADPDSIHEVICGCEKVCTRSERLAGQVRHLRISEDQFHLPTNTSQAAFAWAMAIHKIARSCIESTITLYSLDITTTSAGRPFRFAIPPTVKELVLQGQAIITYLPPILAGLLEEGNKDGKATYDLHQLTLRHRGISDVDRAILLSRLDKLMKDRKWKACSIKVLTIFASAGTIIRKIRSYIDIDFARLNIVNTYQMPQHDVHAGLSALAEVLAKLEKVRRPCLSVGFYGQDSAHLKGTLVELLNEYGMSPKK